MHFFWYLSNSLIENPLLPVFSVFTLLLADFLCMFLEQINSISSYGKKCQMLTVLAAL